MSFRVFQRLSAHAHQGRARRRIFSGDLLLGRRGQSPWGGEKIPFVPASGGDSARPGTGRSAGSVFGVFHTALGQSGSLYSVRGISGPSMGKNKTTHCSIIKNLWAGVAITKPATELCGEGGGAARINPGGATRPHGFNRGQGPKTTVVSNGSEPPLDSAFFRISRCGRPRRVASLPGAPSRERWILPGPPPGAFWRDLGAGRGQPMGAAREHLGPGPGASGGPSFWWRLENLAAGPLRAPQIFGPGPGRPGPTGLPKPSWAAAKHHVEFRAFGCRTSANRS